MLWVQRISFHFSLHIRPCVMKNHLHQCNAQRCVLPRFQFLREYVSSGEDVSVNTVIILRNWRAILADLWSDSIHWYIWPRTTHMWVHWLKNCAITFNLHGKLFYSFAIIVVFNNGLCCNAKNGWTRNKQQGIPVIKARLSCKRYCKRGNLETIQDI